MKNIYELSAEEKSKYRKEFNKTPFFKDFQWTRLPTILMLLLLVLWNMIILPFLEETFVAVKVWNELEGLSITVFAIYSVIFVLIEVYQNICFIRWMKIKHKINY